MVGVMGWFTPRGAEARDIQFGHPAGGRDDHLAADGTLVAPRGRLVFTLAVRPAALTFPARRASNSCRQRMGNACGRAFMLWNSLLVAFDHQDARHPAAYRQMQRRRGARRTGAHDDDVVVEVHGGYRAPPSASRARPCETTIASDPATV